MSIASKVISTLKGVFGISKSGNTVAIKNEARLGKSADATGLMVGGDVNVDCGIIGDYTGADGTYTERDSLSIFLRQTSATATHADLYGQEVYVEVAGAGNYTNGATGGLYGTVASGSGTVAYLQGFEAYSSTQGSASVTDMFGMIFQTVHHSSGVVTNAYGFQATHAATGGNTVNRYGVYVSAPVGSGTITNHYGLYIEDQTGYGSSSKYNLYSAGATANNYFAGTITCGANFVGSVATGIAAAGTVQSTATALTKDFNEVTTVTAGVTDGVKLPTAVAGMRQTVKNTSAATLQVYPATGAAVDALAANTSYTLPSLGIVTFYATSTTQWYAQLGVPNVSNTTATVLASGAHTTTQTSADFDNANGKRLLLVVDVSSAGTGSVTPSLQVKDPVSGNYVTVWTAAAALVGNGTYTYYFADGSSGGNFTEDKAFGLGSRTWRVVMTANNANTATYSVGAVVGV